VRTLDDSDIDRLKDAGAAEVVPEIMEGSLMLASHALMLVGVPFNRVLRRIRDTRERRYGLFRGFFHGVTDETGEASDRAQLRLHSVTVSPGAWAAGRTLGSSICARCRWGRRRAPPASQLQPAADVRLDVGDVVVLQAGGRFGAGRSACRAAGVGPARRPTPPRYSRLAPPRLVSLWR
jgi:CPA2 family monovalent cation:H+ antiporter-2